MRALFLALALATALAAQINLNFESGETGKLPPGWSITSGTGSGYSAATVEEGCIEGGRCALIAGPDSAASNWWGHLSQFPSANAYLSRRIRFRAAVRVEGPGARARLWLRINRRDGAMAFIENTADITSSEWNYYQIEADAAGDSGQILFGVLVYGASKVWADDASLTIVGQVRQDPPEPPRPLSETGLANLTAFARLLGCVRHFHPSDQVTQTDWDLFAIRGARDVEDADTPEQLAEKLLALFTPVAPTVRIFDAANRPELPAELRPATVAGLQIVRWNHYGVYLGTGSNTYRSVRERAHLDDGSVPGDFEDPAKPYEADLGRGLTAMVPLSLYDDGAGTVPHGALPISTDIYIWKAEDRGTRLGGVILAWSVLQHFFPYFDVIETDWPAALASALASAATDTGSQDYLRTLQRLNSALDDGHGSVTGPDAVYTAPLVWDWAEEQLIVTRVKSSQLRGIARGDRVIAIDGRSVEEAMGEWGPLVSGATPQWVRWVTLQKLTYCDPQTRRMELEIEPWASPGSRVTIAVSCGAPDGVWTEPRGEIVQELEPGIMYVDIDRLTAADWGQALPRLESARGIVFDLRGYPRTSAYLAHLTEREMTSAQWHVPTPSKPDRTGLTFARSQWSVSPAQPHLGARRVFLIDGRAISYAETVMGIVENYKLAEIVGAPTAGTNGNINVIALPGGYRMVFTGMKVLKHDGSQHHGVGISPTVPASRTRRGIAEGIDEVLARGLEIARGK